MPWPFQVAPLPHPLQPQTIGSVVYHAIHLSPFSEAPRLQVACLPTVHQDNTLKVLEALVKDGHVLLIEGRYVIPADLPRIAFLMEELNTSAVPELL